MYEYSFLFFVEESPSRHFLIRIISVGNSPSNFTSELRYKYSYYSITTIHLSIKIYHLFVFFAHLITKLTDFCNRGGVIFEVFLCKKRIFYLGNPKVSESSFICSSVIPSGTKPIFFAAI